jgi:hypothetical protein
MHWIRATIPVPILIAIIGLFGFVLFDSFTNKRTFSIFIDDPIYAALASALWGASLGYLIGFFVVRKYSLRLSATPHDVDAAYKAMNARETET